MCKLNSDLKNFVKHIPVYEGGVMVGSIGVTTPFVMRWSDNIRASQLFGLSVKNIRTFQWTYSVHIVHMWVRPVDVWSDILFQFIEILVE